MSLERPTPTGWTIAFSPPPPHTRPTPPSPPSESRPRRMCASPRGYPAPAARLRASVQSSRRPRVIVVHVAQRFRARWPRPGRSCVGARFTATDELIHAHADLRRVGPQRDAGRVHVCGRRERQDTPPKYAAEPCRGRRPSLPLPLLPTCRSPAATVRQVAARGRSRKRVARHSVASPASCTRTSASGRLSPHRSAACRSPLGCSSLLCSSPSRTHGGRAAPASRLPPAE